MNLTAQRSDLEERGKRVLHGAKHLALDTVVPESVDRARGLAERVPTSLDEAQALERKLEQRLGVDTPWERRRRHRSQRRRGALVVVLLGLGSAVAYVVWRKRRAAEVPAVQPPDRRDNDAADPGAPASNGHTREELRPAASQR
jgi:hypothetical protein